MSEHIIPGYHGTTPVTPMNSDDSKGYDVSVSQAIELGTSASGVLTSWKEWKEDAYLLHSESRVPLEDLITMRRTDGLVRGLATLFTLPIKRALLEGKWIASDLGDGEEETEFANLVWSLPPASGGMTLPMSQIVDQILLSITDGFSVFELVSHVPTVGPLKGKKTLKKLGYRDPRTVTLLQDSKGGYAGFRQFTTAPGGKMVDVSLNPGKTALFSVNGHENPLYGVSMFESAYPHYSEKLRWYYLAAQAGQFAAVPGRIGTIPTNAKAEDVYAFMRALQGFGHNTSMVHKEGYKVDSFNGVSGFNFIQYIDHHNLMMTKSVLASFLESEQRTVLVENNTQDASADIFLMSLETLTDQIAAVFTNHIMPKYIRENYTNSERFPVFKPAPLSEDTRRKISAIFEKLSISGILNTTPEMMRELEKHVSKTLGLDIDYNEIEAKEEEASIQEQQAAEAQAAALAQESVEEARAAQGVTTTASNTTDETAALVVL